MLILNKKFYRVVQPYFTAFAVVVTSAALVFTIYFTDLGLQWTTFLTGLLVAAILAEASRMSHSEWRLTRRTAQLAAMKDKLDQAMRKNTQYESGQEISQSRLRLMDESLDTIIAFIDIDGRCRYHNKSFREWLNLDTKNIDDRHIRQILGNKVHSELATLIRQSLDGQPASYVRTLTMTSGAVYKLEVEHLPQFDDAGKVTGFYLLATDVTQPDDVSASASANRPAPQYLNDNNMFVDSMSRQITGREDAGREIFAAIEHSDFNLFCQLITPLAIDSMESEHYEILIRLREDPENMMPPGAFFPIAEQHGLMPFLDRWVVQHVLQRAAIQYQQGRLKSNTIFFINVARATIHDAEFPKSLALMLEESGISAGNLCFEVCDSEETLQNSAVAQFVGKVKALGCLVALSNFGRDNVSFKLIRDFNIEFIKIDGSLILAMSRDEVSQAKVVAINKVARSVGVRTVAEMVESEDAIIQLRDIGIDFAQGFGISHPQAFFE